MRFANLTNSKSLIDLPEHVRAARSYINRKDDVAKYENDEVETIKVRIKCAAEKHCVEISAT